MQGLLQQHPIGIRKPTYLSFRRETKLETDQVNRAIISTPLLIIVSGVLLSTDGPDGVRFPLIPPRHAYSGKVVRVCPIDAETCMYVEL